MEISETRLLNSVPEEDEKILKASWHTDYGGKTLRDDFSGRNVRDDLPNETATRSKQARASKQSLRVDPMLPRSRLRTVPHAHPDESSGVCTGNRWT